MKRVLPLIFAVFSLITSCSEDVIKETSTRSDKEISFRAYLQTRGNEVTTNNLETFYCTAITQKIDGSIGADKFFDDVPFTRLGDYFYSSPTYYWPQDGRAVIFQGYAPSAEEMGTDIRWDIPYDSEKGTFTLDFMMTGFKPAADIADQVDFVYGGALADGTASQQDIEIPLAHQLSQISIRALENNSNYVYRIAGIKIGSVVGEADFNFAVGRWSEGTEKVTYIDEYDTPVELTSYYKSIMNPDSGNAFLIPQTLTPWDPENDPQNTERGAYISVKLQITANDGTLVFPDEEGKYEWAAVPVSGIWAIGDCYQYNLDLSNGAGYTDPDSDDPGKEVLGNTIAFTTNLTAWDESSSTEASNSDLVGHWIGTSLKWEDIYEGESTPFQTTTFDTAEEVMDHLTVFYDFKVTDETTIWIKDADGNYSISSQFNVKDNYVELDIYRNNDGSYDQRPFIQYIDEDESIIVNTYNRSKYMDGGTVYYTRVESIYYAKSPLDE